MAQNESADEPARADHGCEPEAARATGCPSSTTGGTARSAGRNGSVATGAWAWAGPGHAMWKRCTASRSASSDARLPGETSCTGPIPHPSAPCPTEERREPGVGQWHAQRSWSDVSPWQTERLIKGPDDYRVVKYMVENTEYCADYFPIEQAMDWLGDDGVVLSALPHSPMQMLMIDWVGSEEGRFFYHHADYPDLVEDLYVAFCKSREPLYEIAAKSPAPIVLCGDNVDGVLVSPKLFEKYFMPVYEKQAEVLHEHGKLMAVHMDGRVKALKDLIAQTPIDIIEAFHPPPMGDLPAGRGACSLARQGHLGWVSGLYLYPWAGDHAGLCAGSAGRGRYRGTDWSSRCPRRTWYQTKIYWR